MKDNTMDKILEFLHSLIPYSPGDPSAHGLHFLIGAIVQWIFSRTGNDLTGFFVVVLLAFGKEGYDMLVRKEQADLIDIVATLVGAALIIIFSR